MISARVLAALPWAGFALLGACMARTRGVPLFEVVWATASVGAALLPSGFLVPSGWRRRGAEALALPAAFALVMVDDPTMRRMMLPPLLLLAAAGAAAAAFPRASERARPLLMASLALAARAACGLGLTGSPWWHTGLVLAAAAALAWSATRLAGGSLGAACALLAGTLPLESAPRWVPLALVAAAALGLLVPRSVHVSQRHLRGWLPGATALALLAASLAPWHGIGPQHAFPGTRWRGAVAPFAALAVTPFLPGALAGAAWLAATLPLGPVRPPPPDRAAVELTAARPEVALPTSSAGTYMLDLTMANAASVPTGATVATVLDAGPPVVLRAGVDAAEWSHERPDVRTDVAHPLPSSPVWRPGGVGRTAIWGVAGRSEAPLPAGVRPRLVREATLPPQVTLVAAAAGTEEPTPPRDWPLPVWILATSVAVALLQVASRTWRDPAAAAPWTLLAAASLLARMPVEPLRLIGERHAVDIALAAVLSAWLPAAAAWLRERRVFITAAALLIPLALATPHLFPSGGDEQYHLIVLRSLANDHDLDLTNNYDLQNHPDNRIYMTGRVFLHSPVLAVMLVPGYLLGGRPGVLAVLALMGAGVAALVARRALAIGCPPRRVALLVTLVLISYPLATFSTQIWVEVAGALAAIAAAVLLSASPPRKSALVGVAAVAIAVKARLGLVTLPFLFVAWWRRRLRSTGWMWAALAVAGATAAGLAIGWLFLGSPLGMRRLTDVLPTNLRQPILTLGGLAFDPAGGLVAAAPLVLVSVLGARSLWRRGTAAERTLIVGGILTVIALLHSSEWYGGGSPPARYLVPLLPVFALAGAMVLAVPKPWRLLAPLALAPALLTSWTYMTRPHLSFNSGEGGYWLADSLAARFQADARHLFPSFLRPSPATLMVPAVAVLAFLALSLAARRWPRVVRALSRSSVAVWLLCAAGLVFVLQTRRDAVVEVEDPQVVHLGGRLEPPLLTFGRYHYRNAWRVANGEGVVVPLNLPPGARLRLEGWLEGAAQAGADVSASWDGGAPHIVPLRGPAPGSVSLPDAPGAGRHRLRIMVEAPPGGEVVLDRVMVEP